MDDANEQDAADDNRSKTRIFDYETARRLEQKEWEEGRARWQAERTEFLQKLMCGPDLLSWVAPKDGVVADEVLREHLAQLQKVVRYALQYAVRDDESIQLKLSAASTATNMIRANIALAKALNEPKSKTVHGGMRKRRPQD
jgi:hypothetical protein